MGMTRRTTLEFREEMRIVAAAGTITETQLLQANEILLTSTAGGIVPATSVGGRTVGDGQAGPKTIQIHKTYWSRRAAGWLGEPVRYDISM
jgi:branched-chain amino acid aminotransferase